MSNSVLDSTESDAFRIIKTRSVVRNYSDREVSDFQVARLVDGMLAAPTASNKQAWAFVVVRTPSKVRRVRAFCPGIIGSPALIVVACVDRSLAAGLPGALSKKVFDISSMCVAMAVENLLLTAHSMGLGGCPVGSFREEVVRQQLQLPSHYAPTLVVPIGHPAQPPTPSKRRDKEEVVRYDSWSDSL